MSKSQSLDDNCEAARVLRGGRPVRFTREGDDWAVFAISNGGQSRLGVLGASTVERLRQRGQLVQRADGTLEPARQSNGASEAPADRRPRRPRGEGFAPVMNDAESPLTWLCSRKDKTGRPMISEQQYLAGERLRADFERAMLARRVTANWDMTAAAGRSGGNAMSEMSDGAIAARQRFHAAMDAVGPELSSILHQDCCLAAGIE